ncbi:MAG: Smr/MutS family protein [Acidobacteria bacterium]|nr:Smr/MutS family protein [Acidobacteriota bacterium]
MSKPATESLELPALLDVVGRYVVSPLGKWRLSAWCEKPLFAARQGAEQALAETAEAMEVWRRGQGAEDDETRTLPPRFQGLRDLRFAIDKLRPDGAVLEGIEIYDLLELLDRADDGRRRMGREPDRYPNLAVYHARLSDFTALLAELSGKLRPNGELLDEASPQLARIRRQIEQQRSLIQSTLEDFVRHHYEEGVLQENYVTIRNGRLVVPVKSSWKRRIEGVIHASSSTGQTAFIEPIESIELNNRIVSLLEEEQIEILRILREMTARLRSERTAISEALFALADLELIFAKARFGIDFRCSTAVFEKEEHPCLKLKQARHPLLEDVLRRDGREILPFSLTLDDERRVLLVSGPNAGGKTVVLKTIGLLSLMSQAGIPVPAEQAELPWFRHVLADIGDAQSITENLSTFSAHVEQLKFMMREADDRSLVLIDELGAATDPEEGGAFGIAVVDHFAKRNSFAAVSTHLPGLKAYAANQPGVENAAVGFDEETFTPTYVLTVGVPGLSAGIEMAARLGVPDEVIARARQALGSHAEQTATFLRRLHEKVAELESARAALAQQQEDIEAENRRFQKTLEREQAAKTVELQRHAEERIKNFEAEMRAAIQKLDESRESRKAASELQRQLSKQRRQLRTSLQQDAPGGQPKPEPAREIDLDEPIPVGSAVRLLALGTTGRVIRQLSGNRWEVQAGQLKLQVGRDDITELLAEAPPASLQLASGITFKPALKDAASLSEIKVIGKDSDDARSTVDKFLDDAVLAQVQRVRIIHGHGMYTLRNTLWLMFATHPHVERYYQAEQQEGGAGATIVEVRL